MCAQLRGSVGPGSARPPDEDAGTPADPSHLLQQASDELLVAAASLAPLTDVGGRHDLLAQAEVLAVHLCQRVSG